MTIVIKYLFQFPFKFNELNCVPNSPFEYPWFVVLGIQNYCGSALSPHIITELLVLFFAIAYRDSLQKLGLWHFNNWELGGEYIVSIIIFQLLKTYIVF